jgi:cystathionine gamma-lyase
MQMATRILREGVTAARPGTPLHAGPVFTAAFHTPAPEGTAAEYTYARSHNPTWTELERTIAWLEHGTDATATTSEAPAAAAESIAAVSEPHPNHTTHTVVPELPEVRIFSSGMAAVAAVFGAVLRAGDVVVLPEGSYFAARSLVREFFEPMGVTIRLAPTGGTRLIEALPKLLGGARLLWLETPSNPQLDIVDLATVTAAARAAGVLTAVDNSTATPLGQTVLRLRADGPDMTNLIAGADLSVCSDTKAMTGHGDLLLGHVASYDRDLIGRVDRWRTLVGAAVGPMEAWLAMRSLATLPLRLRQTSANALALAEFLQTHPEVNRVLYPGLPGHTDHAIARRQMAEFGSVLSFTLADEAAAEEFFAASTLVTVATSFGGMTTTAERRARWGHDAVAPGFIRMSAGCEAIEDLIADIGRALDALHTAPPSRGEPQP